MLSVEGLRECNPGSPRAASDGMHSCCLAKMDRDWRESDGSLESLDVNDFHLISSYLPKNAGTWFGAC